MASIETPNTRPSSRISSKSRGISQHGESEIFKRLRSINWHHKPPNGAALATDLNAKQQDGSTVIQTLLELDAPQDAVDEAVMGIIDLTNIEYLNVTGRGHETALYTAVRVERPNVARKLLEKGCNVTIRNRQERAPVHAAAINGDVSLITSLLEKDPTLINSQDEQKLTPLDAACWHGNIGVVKCILSRDKGALELTDKSGMTPLMTAVDHGRLDCCQALLDTEEGIRILNAGADDGATALDTACTKGHHEIVTLLLHKGAYKECRDAKGFTPFLSAASNGYGNVMERLIDSGCDVTARTNEGDTAMIRAAFYGHEDIVELLLRYESCLELVNMADNEGITPLILASKHGWTKVISILLANGADQYKADQHSNTALMGACKWRYASIVRMLLQHASKLPDDGLAKILNQKSSDEVAFTALHDAAYNGYIEIVEILLDYGVDVDAVDSRKMNALHYVCRQGYLELVKMLLKETSDVNAADEDGCTALHHAASTDYNEAKGFPGSDLGPGSVTSKPGRHIEIIHHLLQQPGVDHRIMTRNSETALHMACAKGFHLRVEVLLRDPRHRSDLLQWQNWHDQTPLGAAMFWERLQVVRLLLTYVDSVNFGDMNHDAEDIMMWLATGMETHNDLRTMLQMKIRTQTPIDIATFKSWGALELAAYGGFPKILWALLHNTDPTPGRNERMKSIRPFVMNTIRRLRSKVGSSQKWKDAVGKESKQELGVGAADVSIKSPRWEIISKYEEVIRVLKNPPMVDMTRRIGAREDENGRLKPTYGSHSTQMLNSYSACIMDFYQADRPHHGHPTGSMGSSISSDVQVRFDTIGDVIYGLSPDELLDQARKETQSLGPELGPGNTLGYDPLARETIQVRWFHLPANNMKWMKDLTLVMMEDSAIEDGGLSWLDHSWDQVKGQSPWRFMKPKCAYRMAPGNKMRQMALYMPYLNLGIRDALPTPQRKTYEDLLEDYATKVIHGSHTLDEFYYHSCEEPDLRRDVIIRNADQVLSKTIHGPMKDLTWWALVNVDQIWVWVIDEKTIITSSTHRMDSVDDPLITAVLNNLRQAHGTGHGQGSPTSAFQMAGQIVDTCVGFYERQLKLNLEQPGASHKLPPTKVNVSGSIHDVFANAIAQTALKESSLYSRFASHERAKHSGHATGIQAAAPGKRREILEAANLFREIKDIRDEVKMLKTVVEYQTQVQLDFNRATGKGLSGGSSMTSSEGIINRLKEMDKAAARIEMAVNTTLTLEQNEISIAQAEEAVSQGKTLMLFTVVTILFLPLSFFTSFFALDVASFSKTPPWAFLLLFCISFGICVPLAGYAFFSEQITQYYYRFRSRRDSVSTTSSQLDEKMM